MEPYWSEANGHAPHSVKYESEAAVSSFPYCTESSLNFSTSTTAAYSEDDAEYATGRRNKTSRQDPLSHRIIEKRRRDRMNSCLADLSRLIPPQYQRKGRGRIEKTEIIEMAIRHLKHLQNECMQKESEYRLGYTDCMKEAAKFLYDSQMQESCYRLLARLQDHCDEVMKTDCYKLRANCHAPDNVSASSGSPHHGYHAAPALCQLFASSDIEHSNDHNDAKDLSFRNHLHQMQRNNTNGMAETNIANNSTATSTITNNRDVSASSTTTTSNHINNNNNKEKISQPHQAPVITSTAPASLHHNTDSSNHDFESSSHEPLLHTDTSNMHSPPPRDSLLHAHNQHHHHHHHHLELLSSRLRNFSESSHDIEHNNNNYKYKNHIKERFNHELHDEETSSEHCPAPPQLQSEHSHTHSLSEHSRDGDDPEISTIIVKKRKMAESAAAVSTACGSGALDDNDARSLPCSQTRSSPHAGNLGTSNSLNMLLSGAGRDEKPFSFGDIKTELNASSGLLHTSKISSVVASSTTTATPIAAQLSTRTFAVPIFALHGQGTYYVPLNIDYNTLLPFLNGVDLLEKNYTSMPVVHPISINVNFMPPTPAASLLAAAAAAASVAAGKQQAPPRNVGGNVTAAAALAKAKVEVITNGW